MDRNVELFYGPAQILRELPDGDKSEMSRRQLAFLCGLIRQERPKKILEIGVSSGATTAVLLECVSVLDLEAEIYSIDLAEDYYYDRSKKIGYVLDGYDMSSQDRPRPSHTLFTGAYAAERLDAIGDGIDLLILDTVHRLPGEILDFLACYPYMSQGGMVVLHDIVLNHWGNSDSEISMNAHMYATKVLFDVVVADKFIDIDEEGALSNIAAYKINDHTSGYIDSLFSALSLTWTYKVPDAELRLYREFYSRHYPQDKLDLFDMAVRLNQESFDVRERKKKEDLVSILLKAGKWAERLRSKNVYIYGNGKYAHEFRRVLEQLGVPFAGFIVSDGHKKGDGSGCARYLSEIHMTGEKDLILIGVNKSFHDEILAMLQKQEVKEENILFPDEWMYAYLS